MNGLSKYGDDALKIDHTVSPNCAPPQFGSTSMPRFSPYQRRSASASFALKKTPPMPVIFSFSLTLGDCIDVIPSGARNLEGRRAAQPPRSLAPLGMTG